MSLYKLLPATSDYMTYEGSMTQPGCQETVTWIIMNKPLYMSIHHVRLRPAFYIIQLSCVFCPLRLPHDVFGKWHATKCACLKRKLFDPYLTQLHIDPNKVGRGRVNFLSRDIDTAILSVRLLRSGIVSKRLKTSSYFLQQSGHTLLTQVRSMCSQTCSHKNASGGGGLCPRHGCTEPSPRPTHRGPGVLPQENFLKFYAQNHAVLCTLAW